MSIRPATDLASPVGLVIDGWKAAGVPSAAMYAAEASPLAAPPTGSRSRRQVATEPGAESNPGCNRPAAESLWVIRWQSANLPLPTAAGRLAVCFEYMMEHLNQPLKISTLSAMVGLSASRFFELFKSTTGDTPLNWFIRARMEWAGELLAGSNLQVKEVAWQVGYEDPFYFSRLFKSVHGISPSDFRAQNINGRNQVHGTAGGIGSAGAGRPQPAA